MNPKKQLLNKYLLLYALFGLLGLLGSLGQLDLLGSYKPNKTTILIIPLHSSTNKTSTPITQHPSPYIYKV